MKLGVMSPVFESYSFEQVIDAAAELGFPCVEVACWPRGRGVSHIDVKRVLEDGEYAQHIIDYCHSKGVEISATSYYPNTMDSDLSCRAENIAHLKNVIRASARLGVNLVGTFIGRDQYKTAEENLEIVKEVWPEIIALAEQLNVRIAIENCPMAFSPEDWPGGQNLMTTPDLWEKVFAILPSPNLGLNYDPSHFVWQFMDYIQPIYDFRDKIFHAHIKDTKVYPQKLAKVGVRAHPMEFMDHKAPGLGDVKWDQFVSALDDIGFTGAACLEMEDRTPEIGCEGHRDFVKRAKRYMKQYII